MNLKKLSIGGLIIGILAVVVGVGFPVLSFLLHHENGIGIIGGADGPSFWFWTLSVMKWTISLFLLGITMTITSLFCLIFPNFVQKNFSIKTTAFVLGLSAMGGLGLNCFGTWLGTVMENVKDYPIAYPASIVGGVLALVLFFALLVLYCIARRKNFKIVGVILDILTSVIYLPFFFFAEMVALEWLGNIV